MAITPSEEDKRRAERAAEALFGLQYIDQNMVASESAYVRSRLQRIVEENTGPALEELDDIDSLRDPMNDLFSEEP